MPHKSEQFERLAGEHGWKSTVKTDLTKFNETGDVDDVLWQFYALRGDEDKRESLVVQWEGNLQVSASYRYGDYTLRPARKAPVIALLTGQPDPSKFSRAPENLQVTYEEKQKALPFNNDSPAFDILVAVIGKNVTWGRPGDDESDWRTESIPKESNLRKSYFRVKTTSAGRRVLEWANTTGFHACYVDNIVSVS